MSDRIINPLFSLSVPLKRTDDNTVSSLQEPTTDTAEHWERKIPGSCENAGSNGSAGLVLEKIRIPAFFKIVLHDVRDLLGEPRDRQARHSKTSLPQKPVLRQLGQRGQSA